ncbi:MAG: TonB-dependent receptor [Ignavibacteriales bacterium]|nr:MAG: TonB-dependent receptor [Ignavibacteriales bacterium]
MDGKDKIIWIPTRLALQTPRNISKINTQGVELSIEKKLFGDILDISFFYIYTDARNKSKVSENDLSYNKQIIYTPAHRFNFNFTARLNPFSFSLYSSFVDKRFYTTDNNNNYLLPEYFITDISASYNFKIFNHNQSLTLTVYNLLNEDYFVIQSYPMPLRTFLITLNMEIL